MVIVLAYWQLPLSMTCVLTALQWSHGQLAGVCWPIKHCLVVIRIRCFRVPSAQVCCVTQIVSNISLASEKQT